MKTEIIYILDRSGSMASVWDDAFNGLNSFIEEQKKVEGECKFSLVLFDNKYEVPINAEDLQKVNSVSADVAFPRGMTALLDAIGKTINDWGSRINSNEVKPEKVIVVIMTDGYENASIEYNAQQIKDLIKQYEKDKGWEFIFVGAGMDAVGEGAKLGMKSVNTLNVSKTQKGFIDARLYASAQTVSYRT